MTVMLEYRVRPVTRYVVTRYAGPQDDKGGSVSTIGEFENIDNAQAVGYALCKTEHDALGWPAGDDRIKYPEQQPA